MLGTAAAGADAKRLGCAGLSAAALLSRGNMCVNIVACAQEAAMATQGSVSQR